MNKRELEYFKNKLKKEKAQLEEGLNEVAQKDPSAAQGWEATSGNIAIDTADDNEVADKFEEYEGNKGITDQLDTQLEEVNQAIDRIEAGTYGLCVKCNEAIEKNRLEANPSAKTCIKHSH